MYRKDSTLFADVCFLHFVFSDICNDRRDIYYNLVISRGVDKLLTDDSFWSLHRVVGASRQYFTIERKHFAVALLDFTHLYYTVLLFRAVKHLNSITFYTTLLHIHTQVLLVLHF